MSSHALPTSATANNSIPDLDFEEMDIHGKLVVLDAIDLSTLTLTNRCAMILLSGTWCSDDFGRFKGSPGYLPPLSALSKRQKSMALRALTEKELIKTWMIGGTRCWEVAGAYTYKKNLKAKLKERRNLARMKWLTREDRRKRRQEEFQGESYMYEDDGSPNADGVVDVIITTRGGHIPMRPLMFQRSDVPLPKNGSKQKLIVPQPTAEGEGILHMYPSFDVYDGLSELGVVIRHHLLLTADDYGRVRIDIPALHSELGVAVTKRVSTKDIDSEIQRMSESGHLLVIKRTSGTYAYIRDAAQHLKKKKFKNMKLPTLVADKEFTHDSDNYKAYFAACHAHAITRDKVYVQSYTKEGIVYACYQYIEVAAKGFLEKYHEIINTERYADATVDTIFDLSHGGNMATQLHRDELFYYGYLHKMSYEMMANLLYSSGNDMTDPNENRFKILRHLIKMTPQEYLDKLRKESVITRSTTENYESCLINSERASS